MSIEIESGEWLHPSGVLRSSLALVGPFSPAHSTPGVRIALDAFPIKHPTPMELQHTQSILIPHPQDSIAVIFRTRSLELYQNSCIYYARL